MPVYAFILYRFLGGAGGAGKEADMTIRESLEQREKEYLSPYASLSMNSKGRSRPEVECDIRPAFQRDRDKILHCKAFRRLKDKTQVFLSPEGDHYRTRLTHTLEVSQNARTIAKALRLNEDLVEAIALGHDLGHTPFGHAGERALNNVCPIGFEHSQQSVRTVDRLEKHGQGLNLTYEARDGILNHQTTGKPHTLEGKVVRLSDKISYIHHDMDDAVRAGILKETDVPKEIREVIGCTPSERLDHFVHDIVTNSMGKNDICMSREIAKAMTDMRQFMFENVYENPVAKSEEGKAERLTETLYQYYMKHIGQMPEEFLDLLSEGEPREQVVCDYIAAMTDRFAIATYEEIYIPKSWSI
jgi:deoxyguanosinetriphosphate triphosphohydrolase, putative